MTGTAVEVPKNETRDLALVPDAPGTYPLECSHLLHADIFGMTGEIAFARQDEPVFRVRQLRGVAVPH